MSWPQRSRVAGKRKESRYPAFCVVSTVSEDLRRADAFQLLREQAFRKGGVRRIAKQRAKSAFFPDLDQTGCDRCVAQKHFSEDALVRCHHGKTVDTHGLRIAIAQPAYQYLMPDQALQQTLSPTKEVCAFIYSKRRIEIEYQRLNIDVHDTVNAGFVAPRIFQGRVSRGGIIGFRSAFGPVRKHSRGELDGCLFNRERCREHDYSANRDS